MRSKFNHEILKNTFQHVETFPILSQIRRVHTSVPLLLIFLIIVTLLRLFRLIRSSRSACAVLPALVILLCAAVLTAQPPRGSMA